MLWDNVTEYVKATEDERVNKLKKKRMKLSRSTSKTHALWLSYTSSNTLQISCNNKLLSRLHQKVGQFEFVT